tara:strand:- start:49 stop:351 length:303 start_codon:yes stop_codon:yes gene_type:complete
MKKLVFALAFMLLGTFNFVNATNNLNLSDYSNSNETIFSIQKDVFELEVLFTNCVYVVQFQTSEGDVLATFTYTYETDNCASMYAGLRRRAMAEFEQMFS